MIRWSAKRIGTTENPVILFLHGFLGSHDDWIPICNHLADDFYCLIPDLPGHGKTVAEKPSDYTMLSTAKSLISYLDNQQIKHCLMLGYSMGGRLALYLAVHYPRYFEKVILESASPGLEDDRERRLRLENDSQLARKIQRLPRSEFLRKWYASPLFETLRNHPRFAELIKNRLTYDTVDWSASLQGMGVGRQRPLWNQLKEIEIPILILAGEKDEKYRYISLKMKELNPEFSVSIVRNCGHNIHFEDPEKFYQQVVKFFKS